MASNPTLNKIFRLSLVSTIIAQDKADQRGRFWNPHALPIMLGAAHRAEEDAEAAVASGVAPDEAFVEAVCDHFNPSPRMRTMLRKIDPTVDVRRQRWTRRGEDVRP